MLKSAFPFPLLKDFIMKYLNLQKCQDSCRSPATHKGKDICIRSKCLFCSQITLHLSGAVIPYVHRKKSCTISSSGCLDLEVQPLFYSLVIGSHLNLKKKYSVQCCFKFLLQSFSRSSDLVQIFWISDQCIFSPCLPLQE